MSKKLLPEEELEKQYRDYKAQFDQWKEKNKGSEGTEGYIKYVKDFEKWEKEVEQRKIAVRAKAEQERKQGERNVVPEEHHAQDEASVAARYAQEQQQYMAVHLRGIQDQERQQAMRKQRPINQNFNAVPPPDQQHILQTSIPQQSQMHQFSMQQTRQPEQDAPVPLMSITQQRPPDQFDSMINSMEEAIKNGPHIRADPQPSSQQTVIVTASVDESRPMLWGSDGADYLPADSMFLKWGLSALPPNLKTPYHPPHPDTPATPCWYFMKKMEEKGLFYGHNVSLFGIPDVISQKLPNMPELDTKPPVENGNHRTADEQFPDFSRPPPMFDLSRPPPIMNPPMAGAPAAIDPSQFNIPPPISNFRA